MRLVLLAGIFFFTPLSGQKISSFFELSLPEKIWVFTHPFSAGKAFKISQRTRFLTDSIKTSNTFKDSLVQGGQLDAFRHSCWMALLSKKIGVKKSLKLGKAHEKGNYRDWKKGRTELGIRADSLLCVMDLFNNSAGSGTGCIMSGRPEEEIVKKIRDRVLAGEMRILLFNENGERVDCSRKVVNLKEYSRCWNIPGCIVPSGDQ